jgi:hypothetical protein
MTYPTTKAKIRVLISRIGCWTRVEGTPNDPNPNKPFAKMENLPLFNDDGKLNPSITIVGTTFLTEIS